MLGGALDGHSPRVAGGLRPVESLPRLCECRLLCAGVARRPSSLSHCDCVGSAPVVFGAGRCYSCHGRHGLHTFEWAQARVYATPTSPSLITQAPSLRPPRRRCRARISMTRRSVGISDSLSSAFRSPLSPRLGCVGPTSRSRVSAFHGLRWVRASVFSIDDAEQARLRSRRAVRCSTSRTRSTWSTRRC